MEYLAEDGLNLLHYLGITAITDKEKDVFRREWARIYSSRNGLITSTWELYSETLPFICGDGDRQSFVLSQLRDRDFGERIKSTGIDEKLKAGENINEIFKTGPHKFFLSL